MSISQREEKLIIAAQHGNVACFEELYTLYYEKIYALALSILKNSADAEDALQMTFINAWKNLGRLENPAAFSTWLQRITVNQCNSMLRSRRPATSMDEEGEDGELMQIESDLMLPQQYAERDDLSQRLQKIISELSDVQRETVILFYFNEMTIEEIAVIMDCSEGTVKSRLYLARKAIKTEIEEQERKTGEEFYGAVLIPFGNIFVGQVKSGMISKTAAMDVFQRISSAIFNVPITPSQQAYRAPSQGAHYSSAGHPRAGYGKAVSETAKHGARHAASCAAKATIPLWAKITAGVLVVALVAAGGVVAWNAIMNRPDTEELSAPEVQEMTGIETAAPTDMPTEEETEARTIVDVDPDSMPQSLDAFLTEFNFGSTRAGYDVREYDCLDPSETYDILASVIVGNPSCVDSDIYPGEKTQKLWVNDSDPLGKFNNRGGTIIFDEAKLLWIMENIFHNSAEISRDMLDAALEADDDMYEYEQDGKTYVYKMQLGLGKPGYYMTYKQVRFDGERYYFIYDVASGYGSEKDAPYMNTKTFYAEMAEEEIDGEKYWTMYRHSATIPELPAVTGADADTPDEESETQAPDTVDWSSMYYEYMTENEKPSIWADSAEELNSSTPLALHDFDMDGIPELLVGRIFVRGVMYSVLTIKDGSVIYAGEGLGRQNFYSDDSAHHGLFAIDFYGGIQTVEYFGFSDGEWVRKELIKIEYKDGSLQNDIKDQTLYQVYLDCTEENESGSIIRNPKNQFKSYSWGDILSNGWDSFVEQYGY